MKYKKITLKNAVSTKDIPVEECMSIKVVVDGREYSIGEKNGTLQVRVEKGLSIMPVASNTIEIIEVD